MKKTCFVVFCAEILQQFFTNVRLKATNIMRVSFTCETLHCENKIDKEF